MTNRHPSTNRIYIVFISASLTAFLLCEYGCAGTQNERLDQRIPTGPCNMPSPTSAHTTAHAYPYIMRWPLGDQLGSEPPKREYAHPLTSSCDCQCCTRRAGVVRPECGSIFKDLLGHADGEHRGVDRVGGPCPKDLRSARALGVRRRHAPTCWKKNALLSPTQACGDRVAPCRKRDVVRPFQGSVRCSACRGHSFLAQGLRRSRFAGYSRPAELQSSVGRTTDPSDHEIDP